MYLTDLDAQAARDRYNEHLNAARLRKLIREAQAAQQPPAEPARVSSLIARLRAALLTRRPART
jgi:non-homologous end joining protein Ku